MIAVLLLFAALSGSAQVNGDLQGIFVEANRLYESGEFEKAAQRYRELVEADADDATVYYNLGNASYKMNRLGEAVLYYERALRLTPRDRDLRENLQLVRSQLQDRQFVSDRNRMLRSIVVLHDRLNAREMFAFASAAYLASCALGILFILRNTRWVSSLYRRVSVLSPGRLFGLSMSQDILVALSVTLILLLSGGISTYAKIERDVARLEAIVLVSEIPVFSGPSDESTLQFRVHEGTKVDIVEVRASWARIRLPGGLSGWVAADSIARV